MRSAKGRVCMTEIKSKIFRADSVTSDRMHVGQRLKKIREVSGYTQKQLATKIGVHQSALSRLESQSDILVGTLKSYIEGLGAKLHIAAEIKNERTRLSYLREQIFDEEIDQDQLLLPIVEPDQMPSRRDIVFSIRPEFTDKILSGVKTVELRRRFPANVPSGTWAYIYSTTPVRAIMGTAEIADVAVKDPNEIWEKFADVAGIEKSGFYSYFRGAPKAIAISLRKVRKLDRPIELHELRERFGFEPPQSFLYAKAELRQAIRDGVNQLSN